MEERIKKLTYVNGKRSAQIDELQREVNKL